MNDAVEQLLYEGDTVAYIGLIAGRRGEAELRTITSIREGAGEHYLTLNGSNRQVKPWNVIKVVQTI